MYLERIWTPLYGIIVNKDKRYQYVVRCVYMFQGGARKEYKNLFWDEGRGGLDFLEMKFTCKGTGEIITRRTRE